MIADFVLLAICAGCGFSAARNVKRRGRILGRYHMRHFDGFDLQVGSLASELMKNADCCDLDRGNDAARDLSISILVGNSPVDTLGWMASHRKEPEERQLKEEKTRTRFLGTLIFADLH